MIHSIPVYGGEKVLQNCLQISKMSHQTLLQNRYLKIRWTTVKKAIQNMFYTNDTSQVSHTEWRRGGGHMSPSPPPPKKKKKKKKNVTNLYCDQNEHGRIHR